MASYINSTNSVKRTMKRKIRKTEELNFNHCLDTSEKPVTSSKKKDCFNSLLPKIDDITVTSTSKHDSNSSKLQQNRMKQKNKLEMYRRMLKQSSNKLFKSKTKQNKSIKAVHHDNKSEDHEAKVDYSDFYRKCFVRIPSSEIERALNAALSDTTKSISTKTSTTTNDGDKNVIRHNRRLSWTLDNPINNVNLMKSFCDENGTPVKLKKSVLLQADVTTHKLGNSELLESEEASALNTTFELPQQQEEKEVHKSILQKKDKSGLNKQRVTFSNTSYLESPSNIVQSPWHKDTASARNTLSVGGSTPSIFLPDLNLNKSRHSLSSSPFVNKSNAGCTPGKPIVKSGNCKKKLKNGMPDYAKIHQKMYDKMLNIQEYNEQKLQRAKLLLSGHKPHSSTKKLNNSALSPSNAKVEIAKKLRFSGIESKPLLKKKLSNSATITKEIKHNKSPNKRKEQQIEIKNKTHLIKINKENVKSELKGIRTNRRFELLMNYRKAQSKK